MQAAAHEQPGLGVPDPLIEVHCLTEGLDILPLKDKSITFHWEFMFTRPLLQPPDMIAQHDAPERIAQLVDGGSLRTTLAAQLGPIDADTLRRAHAMVEDGHMTGKVVVAGF